MAVAKVIIDSKKAKDSSKKAKTTKTTKKSTKKDDSDGLSKVIDIASTFLK